MALILTAPPAVEPITLAEVKAHLRVDTDAEDTLLQSLILTSRLQIETSLDLALITQNWSIFRDGWGTGREIVLPLGPVQSVSSIRIYDSAGTFSLLPASAFVLDGAAGHARLVRAAPITLPDPGRAANGIEISVTAGFGATAQSVPAPIRHALLLLAAHWYEHREPGEIGKDGTRIPAAVSDLLAPWRKVRL